MASNRMVRREIKRNQLQRLRVKRAELRKQIKNPELDLNEKFELMEKLEKLPRDSSHVRLTRRCAITGRPRGNYRKFGLCRNEIRKRAMLGEIPGLVKASW